MPTVLGMGAHLNASLCLIEGDEAFVTPPAGDLETLEALETYQSMLDQVVIRAGGSFACVAHDLHPDFHSTRLAYQLAGETLGVQHHHAHILTTVAECGHVGPVLGLALDGFGLGPNGESWGGEILHVNGGEFKRLGHLSRLAQPGGDAAAREPWRMAASVLHSLGRGREITDRFSSQPQAERLAALLENGPNVMKTSSCGRLFDAACGLLNVHLTAEFEGQAPAELERLVTVPKVLSGGWKITDQGELDCSVLMNAISSMDAREGADYFHGTLANALSDWVLWASTVSGINTVAFGGGCFFNCVLTEQLTKALENAGMTVLRLEKLSTGDAGLSCGQAYSAALFVERQR